MMLLLFNAATVSIAHARLEVCNKTDLVLMVVAGYDTTEDRTVSEGWWRIYPGFCEVPVDVAMLKGNYYLHAESNPRSTMPDDAFTWGEPTPLCVQLQDFRLPNARFCKQGDPVVTFKAIDKSWRNSNVVNIEHPDRRYDDLFAAKVAGLQRLMSIIGVEIPEVNGILDEPTVAGLHQLGVQQRVAGFDFPRIFPILEATLAQQQKLDN